MSLLKSKKTMKVMGVAAVLIFIAARAFYLNLPKNVIALDINPSIELHTNSFGKVVSVEPINDDAKALMAGYELKDRDLENVIEDIVNRLFLNGYLTSENTNEILVSADASGQSDQILNKVNTVIDDYLEEKQLDVQLLQQKLDVGKEETEEAHSNHVSVGKMAIINKLLETNPNLSVEELSHASVKELMQYFADQDITVGDIVKEYARNHKQTPSVTGAAGDLEDADDAESENMDTVSNASITPASEDTDASEDNDSDSHKNHTKAVRSNDAAKSAEDADNDSDENENETSARKSHIYHNTTAAIKNNQDADEEDSRDQDSLNENGDADEEDKYYDSRKDGSRIREENDSQNEEDSDFEDASENEDDHYLNGDREDNEDGNYQGEDNEDGNHQGYESGDNED